MLSVSIKIRTGCHRNKGRLSN